MLPQYYAAIDAAGQKTDFAGQATEAATNKISALSGTLGDAISKAGGFKDAFDQLNGTLFGSLDATMAAEQAIDDLAKSLATNGNSWNLDTQAGRDNTRALEDGILKARDAAQAKLQESGSVEQANGTYQSYLQRLRDAAGGNVALRGQIDALITKYGAIPPMVTTNVKANGLDAALNSTYDLLRQLWRINGTVSNADIYVQLHGYDAIEQARALRSGNFRWGGITEYAATGLLCDASIYSAVSSGARYAFAEPATGGEAFIPRQGNLARSRAIADRVVTGWLGGQVSWCQPAAAAQQVMVQSSPVTVTLAADDTETGRMLVQLLRKSIRDVSGGNVQLALGKG